MRRLTRGEINELLELVDTQTAASPYLRRGQSFFNILHHMYPKHAEAVRGGRFDPFHDDNKIKLCIQYLTDTLPDEERGPFTDEVIDNIVSNALDEFWNYINTIMFEDYEEATEEQKEEAYAKIADLVKKEI